MITRPKTESPSGGSPLLLLMLAMPVVLWLMMRSQKKKVAAQQAQQRNAEIGDEIMTTARASSARSWTRTRTRAP